MHRKRAATVLLCCVISLIALGAGAKDVKLNEIQVLHSHNSFHLAPNDALLDLLGGNIIQSVLQDPGLLDDIQSLAYSHASLTKQLKDFKVRSFELDVFYDPEGGLFANRAGAKLVGLNGTSDDPEWNKPGYKVLHIPDLDYETTCITLKSCLAEIEAWSEKNPDHIPIIIYIEPQNLNIEEELGENGIELVETLLQTREGEPKKLASTLPIDSDAFKALEAEILEVVDNKKLVTPDELTEKSGSLKEAVIDADKWPAVNDLRGRIVIVISPPFTAELLKMYPSLEGSPFFPSAFKDSVSEHTLFVLPDALAPTLTGNVSTWDEQVEALALDVQDFVEQGYIIRAFTDSFTLEARNNYTNRSVAITAAGAHFLSTDFPGGSIPTLFESNYTVELKDGAAAVCNPITASRTCTSASLEERVDDEPQVMDGPRRSGPAKKDTKPVKKDTKPSKKGKEIPTRNNDTDNGDPVSVTSALEPEESRAWVSQPRWTVVWSSLVATGLFFTTAWQ